MPYTYFCLFISLIDECLHLVRCSSKNLNRTPILDQGPAQSNFQLQTTGKVREPAELSGLKVLTCTFYGALHRCILQ